MRCNTASCLTNPCTSLIAATLLLCGCAPLGNRIDTAVVGPTSAPGSPTTYATNSGPADGAGDDWFVSFEYHFPPASWHNGQHQYLLEYDCPSTGEHDRESHTFLVSDDSKPSSAPVYLRIDGLYTVRAGSFQADPNDTIHPSRETIAVVMFLNRTWEEAVLASQECKATINWDEASSQALTPQPPERRTQFVIP